MNVCKMVAIVVVCGMLSACGKYATKADLNAVSTNLEKTAVIALVANSNANRAIKEIEEVKEVTSVCCAENRARLDALFEKAMRK